eukprot:GHVP01002595.1.p1 GENE.GHVP01002595.1~~GHVP01002595.1.p1  ORF type:complete len:129 (-),score=2.16 GHVP01002595.1:302-688(-)
MLPSENHPITTLNEDMISTQDLYNYNNTTLSILTPSDINPNIYFCLAVQDPAPKLTPTYNFTHTIHGSRHYFASTKFHTFPAQMLSSPPMQPSSPSQTRHTESPTTFPTQATYYHLQDIFSPYSYLTT